MRRGALPDVYTLAFLAVMGLFLSSCGNKEAEQKQKQIDELRVEINQIDSSKSVVEARLDSVVTEKQKVVQEFEQKRADANKYLEQLRAANASVATQKRENERLSQELVKWKDKAEQLARENEQLKTQVAELSTRATKAEQRAFQAEEKLSVAEARIAELEAKIGKTYFVSKLEIEGYRKDEKLKRDAITRKATMLRVMVKIGRPEGVTDAKIPSLKLNIRNPNGGTWYSEPITLTNNDAVTVDIQTENRPLKDKGRYVVGVYEGTAAKLETSFQVQ